MTCSREQYMDSIFTLLIIIIININEHWNFYHELTCLRQFEIYSHDVLWADKKRWREWAECWLWWARSISLLHVWPKSFNGQWFFWNFANEALKRMWDEWIDQWNYYCSSLSNLHFVCLRKNSFHLTQNYQFLIVFANKLTNIRSEDTKNSLYKMIILWDRHSFN